MEGAWSVSNKKEEEEEACPKQAVRLGTDTAIHHHCRDLDSSLPGNHDTQLLGNPHHAIALHTGSAPVFIAFLFCCK